MSTGNPPPYLGGYGVHVGKARLKFGGGLSMMQVNSEIEGRGLLD